MIILSYLKKNQILLLACGYLFLSIIILSIFNGTGTEADSINHYLFAKYAPTHPELYLDHWAKPVFTILASPFAQFGFIGVKIFNVICGLFSVLLVYKIAVEFELKSPILASLFLFIFPLSFTTTYSGLSEPLFAVLFCLTILLNIKQRYVSAAILLSFLPFVRSEGLIIIFLFSVYFARKRQLIPVLFLAVGHLVFAIAGYFYYEDFLWVFNKIPYASLNSHYGSGTIYHFAEQLIYITGVPLLIFFLAGLIRTLLASLGIKMLKVKKYNLEFHYLIAGGFILFFIAHSLFWYLGTFNSMGLKRVFAAVTPLMALICLYGFNNLEFISVSWPKKTLKVFSLAYILIFPFTSNPAAVDWNKDLNLSIAQVTANQVAKYLEMNNFESHRLVYTDPYLSEALHIDPFDSNNRLILSPEALNELRSRDLVIWDNWHAVVDYGVDLNALEGKAAEIGLKRVFQVDSTNSSYVVFN